jgi:hypothetical protein
MTEIRFSGQRNADGGWLAVVRGAPGQPVDGDRMHFSTLAEAITLASGEGWTISLSGATYEAMLDAEAADVEGNRGPTVVLTDD